MSSLGMDGGQCGEDAGKRDEDGREYGEEGGQRRGVEDDSGVWQSGQQRRHGRGKTRGCCLEQEEPEKLGVMRRPRTWL